VIELSDHQFAEREVLNLFVGLMLILWCVRMVLGMVAFLTVRIRTSATNGARIYNTCLSQPENQPENWFSSELRTEHVWDGFCLISLLEDHSRRGSILTVPHSGLQKDRFKAAMGARNVLIQQAGQEEYGHACKKCVRIWLTKDGKPNRRPF
jgi:hypothetical protein